MMKRLFLLRHGKAGLGSTDFNRPLAPRGESDAFWLGQYLMKNDLWPDRVFCSSAARAQGTFNHLQQGVNRPLVAEYRDDLYLASPSLITKIIHRLSPDISSVMIIAHNPGLSELFQQLHQSPSQNKHSQKYPTCALAILDFKVQSWKDMKSNLGQLYRLVIPSDEKNN